MPTAPAGAHLRDPFPPTRTRPARRWRGVCLAAVAIFSFSAGVRAARAQADGAVALPSGVRATWDLGSAYHETTPTRERICINGLWRWQPAAANARDVPVSRWGYFKVPGPWPGITDYMQKDCQTVFAHPDWQGERLAAVTAAWYQREISIPQNWTGRRIALAADYVNSAAIVFIDGQMRGEIRFPGGELDLTDGCRPGATHALSILVLALPLKDVMLSHADTNTAREVKGRVARRGLCGDVFLVSTPLGARLGDVKVDPSFRRGELNFDCGVDALRSDRRYTIEAQVLENGAAIAMFSSLSFSASDLAGGRFRFSQAWRPGAGWDVHTPQRTHVVRCSLVESTGQRCDTAADVRFGFREFWIEGRDFILNGSRIALSAVPLDNAQVSAALAGYERARESFLRLKNIGINFVYTHNYGCEPGSHLGFEEILRAADDVGMLVALSQPHFSHYEWKAVDADEANGYARHAAFYVRAARNHPSVVAYAMNHNATGYMEDMNPDLIDGTHDPRDARAQVSAKHALRAEAIVRRLDPSRVIYHHSSGNLGSMHTINFYPNFVPPQELSDWFEHWATAGVKPLFLCEYGAPFSWDWTLYRGWYQGERAFGSAAVPWQFSLAEWNAQFLGDRAFQISPREAANLRWEAKQFQAGKVWHRWDYPHEVGSRDFDERYPVFALYLADNWPAYRTWGVSATSPWEFGHYWKLRPGVDKRRQQLPVDWANLQRPGFSADFIGDRYERMDLAFDRDDWMPTAAAQALLRYNQPLLAWLAGKPGAFTSKDHLFTAGESFEKQLIVINNSREPVRGEATWWLRTPDTISGRAQLAIPPGEQRRIPLRFALPRDLPAGEYRLEAGVRFGQGETQTDTFVVHVAARAPAPRIASKIALFDPKGETTALLRRLGVGADSVDVVDAKADLSRYDALLVGKQALSPQGDAPDITRVRDGLKVVLFEQTAAVLEQRFGFRVAEYGLRRAFARLPDHPALAGVTTDQLRDWRGEATLLPPRLSYETRPRYGPTVTWCDLPVTRLWRCGNRGNVASVLIEKPPRGDFRSIVDGGFALQYSALLECHEGRGLVVFCQLDVSGRTEPESMGDTIAARLLDYVTTWKPQASRPLFYAGEPAGKLHLEAAGLQVKTWPDASAPSDAVLVLGPGGPPESPPTKPELARWLAAGGRIVAIGLDQTGADARLPRALRITIGEHLVTFFEPPSLQSPFAGVAPGDLMNRDPRMLPLVTRGAVPTGSGVLAATEDGQVIFCQLVPWHFDYRKQSNLKRTFRRAAYALARVLANAGVSGPSPVLERFGAPVAAAPHAQRWSTGLYLDAPEEWDDPYRFFRW
ncbi:MAG: glycoside hydrolase family 2 TIM barrel-domain containing protein [Opitutaceae bacterium]|nr:glycoside hydrolase family 2 TIM barrel-domain containing protein [Opitutaceae bacterium]